MLILRKGRSIGLEAYGHAVVFIRRPSSVRDYCTPRSPGDVPHELQCSVHARVGLSRFLQCLRILEGGAHDRQRGHERRRVIYELRYDYVA